MKATRICVALVLGSALLSTASVFAVETEVVEEPPAVERAGHVVAAVEGGVYTVDLGDEIASPGSILQVYRRLPSTRGSAPYRSAVVWWEVGQLTVTAVGGRTAVASGQTPPLTPLPAELEESGAPSGIVLIGDRVRATGGVGPRPASVRVTFARSDLFERGQADLGEVGGAFFRSWLDGLKSMKGPIQVEIYPQIDGLPPTSAFRAGGNGGRDRDYPLGPSLDRAISPSDDLFDQTLSGVVIPQSRELLVVNAHEGKADTWHYVDPVRLAQRQAERLASALASSLRLAPDGIIVRVIPRAVFTGGEVHDVPGYEVGAEQVRILASAIEYVQPEIDSEESRRRPGAGARNPQRKAPAKPSPKLKPETAPQRRRLLERPPEVSSKEVGKEKGVDAG